MESPNEKFSLQLIVIGILIPAYLQTLPILIERKELFGIIFTFEIFRIFFYLIGVMWFVCLLFGTFSLVNVKKLKKISLKIYNGFFIINNIFTLLLVLILFILYLFQIIIVYNLVGYILLGIGLILFLIYYLIKWLRKKKFMEF